MKWSAVFLLLIPFLSINAQDCSYRVNSVSGMDGTRLVITEPIDVSANFAKGTLQAWTTIYGDTALVLAFVIIDPYEIPIKKGDEVRLIIAETDSFVLQIFQDPVLATSTPKKLTCLIALSADDIAHLEKNTVTNVLFEGVGYREEGKVKKKNAEEMLNLIVCTKKYLP